MVSIHLNKVDLYKSLFILVKFSLSYLGLLSKISYFYQLFKECLNLICINQVLPHQLANSILDIHILEPIPFLLKPYNHFL